MSAFYTIKMNGTTLLQGDPFQRKQLRDSLIADKTVSSASIETFNYDMELIERITLTPDYYIVETLRGKTKYSR